MSHRTLIALLCASALLLPLPATADWHPVGPFGGHVMVLAVDPATPSNVLAGTRVDGLFRSTDRGASWKPVAGESKSVRHIVFDPRRPGTVYASLDFNLWKSTDGGRDWSFAGGSLPMGDSNGILAMAIDQRRSIFYALLTFGLYKSTDGGAHWARARGEVRANDLAVDPLSGALYAAADQGLFRSRNGGGSWQRLPLAANNLRTVSIAPSESSVLYAGASDGLYRSTDGGTRWRAIHGGLSSPAVTAVVVHPNRPGTLYAALQAYTTGTTGGLFRSVDGGLHWQRMGVGLPGGDASFVTVDPTAPSRVYAGFPRDGVFRSADAGSRWAWASQGLRTFDVTRVVLDPERPGTLYTGPTETGVYKSTDAGRTWRLVNSRIHGGWSTVTVALDPQQTATVYAGMPRRLERSDDGGEHWRRVDRGLRGSFFNGLIAIDPNQPSTLYAGGSDQVFKSTDRGETWTPVSRLSTDCLTESYDLEVSAAAPSLVFASALGGGTCPRPLIGLFKSVDGGAHWTEIADFMRQVIPDPTDPQILYGLDYFGHLKKSTDGGATFVRLDVQILTALAINPDNPSRLYGGDNNIVLTSDDGGLTWEPFGSPIDSWVFDLAVDTEVPGRLWAATSRGLFVFDP
jgi:photosystem II stability/assembly factor-like uncharacterized protein